MTSVLPSQHNSRNTSSCFALLFTLMKIWLVISEYKIADVTISKNHTHNTWNMSMQMHARIVCEPSWVCQNISLSYVGFTNRPGRNKVNIWLPPSGFGKPISGYCNDSENHHLQTQNIAHELTNNMYVIIFKCVPSPDDNSQPFANMLTIMNCSETSAFCILTGWKWIDDLQIAGWQVPLHCENSHSETDQLQNPSMKPLPNHLWFSNSIAYLFVGFTENIIHMVRPHRLTNVDIDINMNATLT